ncbi:MAG: hypothetical protein ACXU9L_07455 [Thermodesulfobacteriota bacterium]
MEIDWEIDKKGILEQWNNGILSERTGKIIEKVKHQRKAEEYNFLDLPIIPIFHHSIIPKETIWNVKE